MANDVPDGWINVGCTTEMLDHIDNFAGAEDRKRAQMARVLLREAIVARLAPPPPRQHRRAPRSPVALNIATEE